MERRWSDDPREAVVREIASGGEWRNGVYIPAKTPESRSERGSLLHDVIRALLDLRAA